MPPSRAPERYAYPAPPRNDQVDDYFGTRIPDPFRPLEELDAPAVRAWIEAENALTESVLSTVPQREAIRARLVELWNYERRSVPERAGASYAYFRNTGLQNQSVLYVTRDLAEPGRVLIDPNALSEDGTVALSGYAFSDDGTQLAYSVSTSGSDWQEWRVRDVFTGADRADIVRWSKFSGAAWRRDGSGFYYSRYDAPDPDAVHKGTNYFHKLYFHRLGTPQSTDLLVYERPDHKDWNVGAHTTEDGRYLVVDLSAGTESENRVVVLDLGAGGAVTELFMLGDARWQYIANDGTTFYFVTTKDAPRGRIVAADLRSGEVRELVPQSTDVLDQAAAFGDRLMVAYLRDAHARLALFDLDGTACGEPALPGLGSVGGLTGKRSARETFYSFTSYTEPASIYRYDFEAQRSAQVFTPRLAFERDAFATEHVFYNSPDGTRVPMMITARKGTPRDGSAPTILYGYGGFDIPVTPAFSSAIVVWLEMGGVFAAANLRGGGEYGAAWHRAGIKEHKQNVFDDFIAAAEWLIGQGWTSSAKLAIHGGSNGGLLVGAVMTQRPELFAAALPSVAVMDMLRFQHFTIGWAWTSDYGSSDDPAGFRTLLAYSPLHAIRDGVSYPATLIATGDHDDRVYPAHSFKFAARLQEAQGGDAPVLLRVETKAGHGAGKPTAKIIADVADRYAFLVRVLGIGA